VSVDLPDSVPSARLKEGNTSMPFDIEQNEGNKVTTQQVSGSCNGSSREMTNQLHCDDLIMRATLATTNLRLESIV
jgi:hypothetical protein